MIVQPFVTMRFQECARHVRREHIRVRAPTLASAGRAFFLLFGVETSSEFHKLDMGAMTGL